MDRRRRVKDALGEIITLREQKEEEFAELEREVLGDDALQDFPDGASMRTMAQLGEVFIRDYERKEQEGEKIMPYLQSLPTDLLKDIIAAKYASEEECPTEINFREWCQFISDWSRHRLMLILQEKHPRLMRQWFESLDQVIPAE